MAAIRPPARRKRRRFSREVRALLDKACDSFYLAIELYSRPQERGRNPTITLLLAHAFEMLLKAGMRQRGADIWRVNQEETLTFRQCTDFAVTDSEQRFVEHSEGLVIRALILVRNQEQHYLTEVTERALAVLMAWSIGAFGGILQREFQYELSEVVPMRAIPDIVLKEGDVAALATAEIVEVRDTMKEHSRSQAKGEARLRPWAAINRALGDNVLTFGQDTNIITQTLNIAMRKGTKANEVFDALSTAPVIHNSLHADVPFRFSRDAELTVRLVASGSATAGSIPLSGKAKAEHWNLFPKQVAKELGITNPKLRALGRFLSFNYEDGDEFVDVVPGGVIRYSSDALAALKEGLLNYELSDIWEWSRGKRDRKDVRKIDRE